MSWVPHLPNCPGKTMLTSNCLCLIVTKEMKVRQYHFLPFNICVGNEAKEMKPEQIYTETKYLLFTIIKALPKLSPEAENDIKMLLADAQKVQYFCFQN